MKKSMIITAVLALFVISNACTQPAGDWAFNKQTHLFSVKDGQELYLDLYSPKVDRGQTPCVLFVFGGAFARGARDVEKYIPYFDFLVRKGYSVVSMDYRLGLKDAQGNANPDLEEFYRMFVNALDMAVDDMFDATNFILNNASKWNIDPTRIVSNGSSAGAVTVLQAEYILSNRLPESEKLPENFRYAGTMSFAGAVFVPDGNFKMASRPAPMLIMHGDADLQVPYGILEYEGAGFFGGEYVAGYLNDRDWPYYFYSFENYGHEIASSPMQDNLEDIAIFLDKYVAKGEQLKINKVQVNMDKPAVKKDFTILDYIRGNFDR